MEVDFVLKYGKDILAIEVKSQSGSQKTSGMDLFSKMYPQSKLLLVSEQGMPIEQFLKTSLMSLF